MQENETPGAPCVEHRTYLGWPALQLSNGLVSTIAVPAIGGRLMALRLGEAQFLFHNPALAGRLFSATEYLGDGSLPSWKNFGGAKTWPAPQGWDGPDQWPGPPDPILDGGPYTPEVWQAAGSAGLVLTSAPDPYTGLQITRRIALRGAGSIFSLDLSFQNVSSRSVRWAIWDVVQLECGIDLPGGGCGPNRSCCLYVPLDQRDPRPPYWVLFGDDHTSEQVSMDAGILQVPYRPLIGKFGIRSSAGWLAFANGLTEDVFCIRFPYVPDAAYPDGGASVECWIEAPGVPAPIPFTAAGYLLEAEVLSPLYSLVPGQEASLHLEWALARCPQPLRAVTDAGCAHQPLTLQVANHDARLCGVFGCFAPGTATLVWLDAAEQPLLRQELQQVSPLTPLRLDLTTTVPPGARHARLALLASDGSAVGTLGTCAVHA